VSPLFEKIRDFCQKFGGDFIVLHHPVLAEIQSNRKIRAILPWTKGDMTSNVGSIHVEWTSRTLITPDKYFGTGEAGRDVYEAIQAMAQAFIHVDAPWDEWRDRKARVFSWELAVADRIGFHESWMNLAWGELLREIHYEAGDDKNLI
jgi:hypothetical protein